MTILALFVSFIQIGLFSFGGGYAALPLIQSQVVDLHGWLTMAEFSDLITISQMTPGPIAINAATFVGIKIAGVPGAIVATLGCILPACIIVTVIAKLYLKYRNVAMLQGILHSLRPAVVALIASAGISVMVSALWGEGAVSLSTADWKMAVIFVICLIPLLKTKVNPVWVMAGAGVLNLLAGIIGGSLPLPF